MLAMGFNSCEIRGQLMGTNFAELVEYSLSNALWSAIFGRGTSDLLAKISKRKGFFHGDNLENTVDMALAMKRCSVSYNIPYEPVYQTSENEESNPLMYGMCRKFRNTTFRDFKLFSPNRSCQLFQHLISPTEVLCIFLIKRLLI